MRKCEVKYMQKYYTAVGRFERKGHMGDMTCPMVIINKREYALDIQEMILWATLNWQIMDARVLEDTYIAKLKASGIAPRRSFLDCMRRLLQRGLVVEGCGETGEDALYALLSGLYVVPISDSLLLRLLCLWCGDEEVAVCEQLYGVELLVSLAVTPSLYVHLDGVLGILLVSVVAECEFCGRLCTVREL